MKQIKHILTHLLQAFMEHGDKDLNDIPVSPAIGDLEVALEQVRHVEELMERITSFLEGFEDDEAQGGLPEGLMAQIRRFTDKRWRVQNITDGVPLSHELLTMDEADQLIKDFPKRFEHQGYYLNARQERMDPKDVTLVIYDVDAIDPDVTFKWTDKTGRGFKDEISLEAIIDGPDMPDFDDKWLHTWARNAEIGDTWEGREHKYVRIK